MASLLHNLVDAEQWEAEDFVGRLALIAHAAFLHAGFVPCGAQPPSGHHLNRFGEPGTPRFLCRRYTAPPLAHREDAAAAVLLCASQESGDLALVAFLTTTTDGGAQRAYYRERLAPATVAPLLSLSLDDAGRRCSRISRSLATGVCSDLKSELWRANGLPLTSLASLPDDAKVEILRRLRCGADLARAECSCRDLRRVVAEHGGELWKHMYWHEPQGEMWKPRDARYTSLFDDMISLCVDGALRGPRGDKLIAKIIASKQDLDTEVRWLSCFPPGTRDKLIAKLFVSYLQLVQEFHRQWRCLRAGTRHKLIAKMIASQPGLDQVFRRWRCFHLRTRRKLLAKLLASQQGLDLDHEEFCQCRCCFHLGFCPVEIKESEGEALSWKVEYLKARNRVCPTSRVCLRRISLLQLSLPELEEFVETADGSLLEREEFDETAAGSDKITGGRVYSHRRQKVPWKEKDYSQKRYSAGAMHSPSSRYRWSHR